MNRATIKFLRDVPTDRLKDALDRVRTLPPFAGVRFEYETSQIEDESALRIAFTEEEMVSELARRA